MSCKAANSSSILFLQYEQNLHRSSFWTALSHDHTSIRRGLQILPKIFVRVFPIPHLPQKSELEYRGMVGRFHHTPLILVKHDGQVLRQPRRPLDPTLKPTHNFIYRCVLYSLNSFTLSARSGQYNNSTTQNSSTSSSLETGINALNRQAYSIRQSSGQQEIIIEGLQQAWQEASRYEGEQVWQNEKEEGLNRQNGWQCSCCVNTQILSWTGPCKTGSSGTSAGLGSGIIGQILSGNAGGCRLRLGRSLWYAKLQYSDKSLLTIFHLIIMEQVRYRKLSKIGQGAYGTVYKAEDAATNTVVALKKVKVCEDQQGMPVTAVREIAILQTLNHPGIVKLLNIHQQTQEDRLKLYMILQFVPQTLSQFIRRNNPMPPCVVRVFMFQLIRILEYLITKKIIHRDLKPSNILVTSQGSIKLCDFGLAKRFEVPLKDMTPGVGTLWYRAPEILLGSKKYWMTAEMWALGCIMGEMCEGKPLFRSSSEIGQLFEIFSGLGTPTIQNYPDLYQLKYFTPTFPQFKAKGLEVFKLEPVGLQFLYRLLAINPDHRMTIKQALGHEYLQNCF